MGFFNGFIDDEFIKKNEFCLNTIFLIRLLDIVLAILALVICLPLMLVMFFFLLLMQGTPVIFKQQRVGKNKQLFTLYKFRTMRPNSEDKYGLTEGLSDKRITRLGRVLRRFKLDELPQLINVLKGEMSMVGSRPQLPYYVEIYDNYYSFVLRKKPGLFSSAVTAYHNEELILDEVENPRNYYEEVLLPAKCKMDIEMVEKLNIYEYFRVIVAYFVHLIFKR